jgi:hypothetical protein
MADYLINFSEAQKIKASEVNSNFQYVLDKTTDNAEKLENYLDTELAKNTANTNSSIATLQDSVNKSIDTLETTVSNLTDTGTDGLFYKIAPNHGNRIGISSGYTAPKYGWIDWYVLSSGLYSGRIYINGVTYGVCFNTYGDRTGGGNAFIFVRPGDVVTFDRSTSAFFMPCQGV